MKMYEILMVVLFSNFVMFLFGGIFSFYNIFKIHTTFASPASVGGLALVGTIIGVASAAIIINYIGSSRSGQYAAIVTIGGAYWGTYGATTSVFMGLLLQIPDGFGFILWLVISVGIGYVFVSGITQMITGGWRGYK